MKKDRLIAFLHVFILIITTLLLSSCGRSIIQTPIAGSADMTAQIEQINPKSSTDKMFTGRIVAMTQSPNNERLIYAASESGGIFRSQDGGYNWEWVKAFPCFRTCDIKFHPNIPNLIFCTTLNDFKKVNGGGIWYSKDAGITWTKGVFTQFAGIQDYYNAELNCGYEIAFLNNDIYFGSSHGYSVCKITGDVFTFKHFTSSQQSPSLFPLSQDLCLYKYGLTYGIIKNGNHIEPMSGPGTEYVSAFTFTKNAFAQNPFDANMIFAVGNHKKLLTYSLSANSLNIFNELPTDVNNTRPSFIKSYTTGNNEQKTFDLYYCNGIVLYVSSYKFDGGTTLQTSDWQLVETAHSDLTDILFDPATKKPRFISGDGGIMFSEDGGRSFPNMISPEKGLNALQVYDINGRNLRQSNGTYMQEIFWGTQDNGIWAGNSLVNNWKRIGTEGGIFRMDQFPVDESKMSFSFHDISAIKNFKCTGANGNCTPFPFPNPDVLTAGVIAVRLPNGNYFSSFQNYGFDGPHVYINALNQWFPYTLSPMGCNTMSCKASGGNDPVIFFTNNTNKLFKLSGSVAYPLLSEVSGVFVTVGQTFAINPADPDHILFADRNMGKVIYSHTSGAPWQVDESLTKLVTQDNSYVFGRSIVNNFGGVDLPNYFNLRSIAFYPKNPNVIWAGTMESGAMISVDGGASWQNIPGTKDIPDIRSFLFISESSAYISSYGRGIFKITLTGLKPKTTPIVDYGPWIILTNGIKVRLRDLKDPEICPKCHYIQVENGYFSSVKTDKNNNILSATINGGTLTEINASPSDNFTSKMIDISTKEAFDKGSWISTQLVGGDAITALILEGTTLKGIIAKSKDSIALAKQ